MASSTERLRQPAPAATSAAASGADSTPATCAATGSPIEHPNSRSGTTPAIPRRATARFEEALTGPAALDGTRYGEAGSTWDSLGIACHRLGEHERAVACFQCALRLHRELGATFGEAGIPRHLGDTCLAGLELPLAGGVTS